MSLPYLADSRPKLANGRPCWIDSLIVLPPLLFEPLLSGEWEVRVMDGQGAWASKTLPGGESIFWLMKQWVEDPERLMLEFFHGRLPKGKNWTAPIAAGDFDPEELGL